MPKHYDSNQETITTQGSGYPWWVGLLAFVVMLLCLGGTVWMLYEMARMGF